MIKNKPLTRVGKGKRKAHKEGDECRQCETGTMQVVHDRIKCTLCAYAERA